MASENGRVMGCYKFKNKIFPGASPPIPPPNNLLQPPRRREGKKLQGQAIWRRRPDLSALSLAQIRVWSHNISRSVTICEPIPQFENQMGYGAAIQGLGGYKELFDQ
eukprot:sb/3477732/